MDICGIEKIKMSDKYWQETIEQIYNRLVIITEQSKQLDKEIKTHDAKWDGNKFDWSELNAMFKKYNRLGVEWRYFTAIYLLKIWNKPYDIKFIRNFNKG